MSDPYLELVGLLGIHERKEPLSAERRAREFLKHLQELKPGDEATVRGFLLLRIPPNAPKDAVYYILAPLPPGELRKAGYQFPRAYAVVRIDDKTEIKGRLSSGSYVEVKAIVDAYPWGNLKLLRALRVSTLQYSQYWAQYRDLMLKPKEVEELIDETVHTTKSFRDALLYSIYGGTPLLESPTGWGEGSEFSLLSSRKREVGLVTMWRILRVVHSLFPWELQLRKERKLQYSDPFFDLDFTVINPNQEPFRYYVPGSPLRISKFAQRALEGKNAIGLLSLPKRASPVDGLVSMAELPFVFIPQEDERPYLQDTKLLSKFMPNLIATIFIERERYGSVSIRDSEVEILRRKFEEWLIEKREEYGWKFDVLTIPGAVLDIRRRYELTLRLFGSVGRFRGRLGRNEVRTVMEVNEEILNDWMVVVDSLPQSELQKLLSLKEYRLYLPADRRIAKALEIFRDIEATTLSGEVDRVEFLDALLKFGFSREWAERTLERLIKEGYIYEPARGKLKLVR
ncbi:hypothetical protein [Thermococcus gorgonarius]|uniref:Uncharacterized protein n=1 Tax=Thermococcus gorgonarius TaxID=71997 RepID=A0A2Z2M5N5_THEGO|nr:hypothetical protein [Thermococcus gorgonarius]ASJ00463.1 hypothetical protein A3K92_02685 [Thermococcus gorgonarius]